MLNFIESSGEPHKGGTDDPQPVMLGQALQDPLLSLWQHQRMNSLEEKLIRSYTEQENLPLNSFIFKASSLQ